MRFCFDFDGTLVELNPNVNDPTPGPWKPNAIDTLLALVRAKHQIVISSCRNNRQLNPDGTKSEWYVAMRTMIETEPALRDAIAAGAIDLDDGSYGRPVAQYYFDDRAVGVGTAIRQVSLAWIERAYGHPA